MPNITQARIDELETIAAQAFESVQSAIDQKSIESAATLYADLDDMLAETSGLSNPLNVQIDTSNPLHTYRLQRAVGGSLADSVLYRKGIFMERKFRLGEFLSGIRNEYNTYERIREVISSELRVTQWSEILNVLAVVRSLYKKPVLATTPSSS